jgi:hypothetical protein
VRQNVDDQQHGDHRDEKHRRQARPALHVEQHVGIQQRAEHEMQSRGGNVRQPAPHARRLQSAVAPRHDAGQQQTDDGEIQALLQEDQGIIDAPDHDAVEDEAGEKEG